MSEATIGERVAWLEAQLGVAMRERVALAHAVADLQARVDCLEESQAIAARISTMPEDETTVPGVRAVLHRYLTDAD